MTEADAGLSCLLAGGDDYELCFTVTSEQCAAAASLLLENGITVTTIGRIIPGQGVVCYDAHGKPCTPDQSGYEHFT